MKFETTKQMLDYAYNSMLSISIDPYVSSKMRMLRLIKTASGLSLSTVEKFWQTKHSNMTVSNLDKLLKGIRKVRQELANS